VQYLDTMGLVMLSIYSLIAQIMLVNLLIAMMGDSYTKVQGNAEKEWKFYRYSLAKEFRNTSFDPPPFNLIIGPVKHLIRWSAGRKDRNKKADEGFSSEEMSKDLKKKMVQNMSNLQEAADQEERKTITYVGDKLQSQIGIIQSHVRELMSEHATEQNFIHEKFATLDTTSENRDKATLEAIQNLTKEMENRDKATLEAIQNLTREMEDRDKATLSTREAIEDLRKEVSILRETQNKLVGGLKGNADAVLLILKVEETKEEFLIMAARRVSPAFAELVTGTLDGTEFRGEIPTLLEAKSDISIKQQALVDLTGMANLENQDYKASAQPSKEVHIYLWQQSVTLQHVEEIKGKIKVDPNEEIFFKLVELHNIWKNTTNATALAAVSLYQFVFPKTQSLPK